MDPSTVLRPVGCDLKALPLGALEAFVLSQLDGHVDLEALGEVTGLSSSEVLRIVRLLLDVGAVSEVVSRPPASKAHGGGMAGRAHEAALRSARVDPRAEQSSVPPGPRTAKKSLRPASRAEKTSLRPAPRAEKHSARPAAARSLPPQPTPRHASENEACDLDEATLAAITVLDAKLGKVDHYALLEVDRGAEKKAIKRAFFGFAARFHPDRFFGKKLGASRARIDRIFHRLTEAHDTLTNAARRAAYDATLAPAPAPARARPSRKMSKAMRAASRQMKAVKEPSVRPSANVASRRPSSSAQAAARRSVAPARPTTPPVARADLEEQAQRSLRMQEKKRDFHTGAAEARVQARVDLLVTAAKEALEANDLIGASNSFRLALEHREDEHIRMIFADVDARARAARFEKNIGPARSAEREERWADAAVFLARAHEAKPDCDVASRAARAVRRSGGDLGRAAGLAEQAVALAPRNVAYRVTLAEIYLAANRLEDAEEECSKAREIAPKDEQLKALTSEIARKAKARAG